MKSPKFSKYEINLDSVNLIKYSVARPHYAAYFEDLINTSEGSVMYSPPFPNWLFLTMRGILDSKYRELILMEDHGSHISRMPEFVFSWLGKFKVDRRSFEIKQLDFSEKL